MPWVVSPQTGYYAVIRDIVPGDLAKLALAACDAVRVQRRDLFWQIYRLRGCETVFSLTFEAAVKKGGIPG